MKLLPALLVVAPVCLWATACSAGTNSTSATVGTSPSAALTSASRTTARARNSVYGDYDNDDLVGGRFGDADNDDSTGPRDRDNDSDNGSKSYYDQDDDSVRAFGQAANGEERRAISSLVRRYFAVAAAGDGAGACAMIVPSLRVAIPEDLGRPPGPSYARGDTCRTVVSRVFSVFHVQLAAYASRLAITAVRVEGDRGLVVLGFASLPGRQIGVIRVSGVGWKVETLLDRELP
jgi:hypothetical protein